MRLTMTLLGDVALDRTLGRVAEGVEDMRPAWQALARRFETAMERQFESEGSWGGTPWPPLSPDYARWKARVAPGQPILRLTNLLVDSLTDLESPASVHVIEPDFMVLGTAVEYGAFHHEGAGNLPQRKIVALPEAERRQWVKVVQRFILTGEAE